MRIAFVPAARLLSEAEPNGEALIASAMLRGLAKRGHRLLAYCERSDLEPIEGVEVREIAVEGPTVPAARLRFARAIASDVAREKIDVAHLLFPFTTDDGYSFVRSAPLVVGPVNVAWPSSRAHGVRGVASAPWSRLERRAHARTVAEAARLLVVGPSAREKLPWTSSEEVPFGVDVERFSPRPFPSEPTIVFPSVLQRRKGVEVLLRALPLVLHRIPRARAVFAGADPEGARPALEATAERLGVAHAVSLEGPVAPADMPALYARATVVCQPSFGEPFGMTVIEAMACGRPVVGTITGGIPDAVVEGIGGRLVREDDERALADALCWILSDETRARDAGSYNRARAQQRYALHVVLDRIEGVYRAVAARESARV